MYRRITASCIILFILVSGFKNETLKQTGFLGKSVTLPSGVNDTGKFTTIEWSIFDNNTYIATFSGGPPKYYQQQRDRLNLNTATGNLEIRDLRREDSGTYTVYVRKTEEIQWNNKVKLSVQEKLPGPSLNVINSKIEYGMCKILLKCSVKSETIVNITCGPEGFPHGCGFNHLRYVTTGQELEAWCSPTQDVNITCTANDGVSTSASTVRTRCLTHVPDNCSLGCRIKYFFIGLIIAAVCFVLYIKHDALSKFARTSWARLTEWLSRRNPEDRPMDREVRYENVPLVASTEVAERGRGGNPTEETPRQHGENMQTPHTCNPGGDSSPGPRDKDTKKDIDMKQDLSEEKSIEKADYCDGAQSKETAEL